jgi:hypothetical protein
MMLLSRFLNAERKEQTCSVTQLLLKGRGRADHAFVLALFYFQIQRITYGGGDRARSLSASKKVLGGEP